MADASIAAGMAAHTPAAAHQHTARHSMARCRICPMSAAGAQPIKYNRLIPPASYCDMPAIAVKYNTNSDPPPTPNPLIMPVAKPMMTENTIVKRTPP